MKSLCIKTNNKKVINYLLSNFEKIELDNVYFSCHKFNVYNNIFIHYKGDNIDLFVKTMSNILSFLVLDIYENNILQNILKNEYFYFDKLERISVLDKYQSNCLDNIDFFETKENTLFDTFYNYISSSNYYCKLYLKGFITFRLKEYISQLENSIDNAVNQYLVEKEYAEFVSLLKVYIRQEGYNSDVVHLVYRKDDSSLLLDKDKNIIDTSINLLNAKYLSDISFSSSDMILNTLLNLLPKKIFVHLFDLNDEDEFIDTLKAIFEERIVVCLDIDSKIQNIKKH